MAIVVGTPSTVASSVTTQTLAVPGSAGDLLIAVCSWRQVRSWVTGMSGWTQLGTGDYTGVDNYNYRTRIYYKIHSGSESNASFEINGGAWAGICIFPISGATAAGLPADKPTKTDNNKKPVTFKAATTTVDGSLLIKLCTGNSGNWTYGGTSTLAQEIYEGGTAYTELMLAYAIQSTAGAVAEETFYTDPSFNRTFYHWTLIVEPDAATAPTISSVTLSGTSQIGQTLTATVVTDQDPVDSTAYQWEKASDGSGTGAADISGETSSTLALTYADFGDLLDTAAYVRCGAIATKNALPSDEAFSAWQQVTVPSSAGLVSSPLKSPFLIA